MRIKRDYLWFSFYVEGVLGDVEKGLIDEKKAINLIREKYEQLKKEGFSKIQKL